MNAWIWIVAYLFLWASGWVVTTLLRLGGGDRLVRLAIQMALGLSIWPIVFLGTSTVGLAWSPLAMRVVVFATIVVAVVIWTAGRRPAVPPAASRRWLLILAVSAIATRILQMRNLAFPGWVDGVHHGMIVRLLLEQGAVPATADPYIAGAPFAYHWGFHVPAAFVAAATGNLAHSDLPTFLLHYGQALNALTLLIVYAAARVLLRSRTAGLFAAVLAVFVSQFPAFYLSWGRYSHLAGTLVLPPLLIALWKLAHSRRWLIPAVILTAGLVLIHVRIALFAMVFAVLMFIVLRARRDALLRWSIAAILAALVMSPWLYDLARMTKLAEHVTPSDVEGIPAYVVNAMRNRELLSIATAGITGMTGWLGMPLIGRILSALWFVVLIVASRKKGRPFPWRPFALLGACVLLLTIVLYWRPWRLDLTSFASFDSMVITLFLPLSIAGAALLTWVLSRLPQIRPAIVAAALVLLGAAFTRNVVNPNTILAEEADLRAMRWIERNVPRDAIFAVDARPWLSPAWVGTDGGYWLHVATGRPTILPPLLYAWALPRNRVEAINARLQAPFDRGTATHIYIGALGDAEKRRALLASPRIRLIHRDGDALVFIWSAEATEGVSKLSVLRHPPSPPLSNPWQVR